MAEGYLSKEFGVRTKRYCQTMELKDDAALIRKYKEAHDKEHFWDEIKEGIKAVGILEMEIYILGNRLLLPKTSTGTVPWHDSPHCPDRRNGKPMWPNSSNAPPMPPPTRNGR